MKRVLMLIVVLLVPAAAQAVLLSSGAVLRRMVTHREELQLASMSVRGNFALRGDSARSAAAALGLAETDQLTLPATVVYKMPGRCRVELDRMGAKAGPGATNVSGTVSTAGANVAALRMFASLVCPLLDGQGGADGPTGFLRSAGIDTSKVELSRAPGNIVSYVIGGRSKDTKVPSLWVDKERSSPLRVIAKADAGVHEARLTDYSSAIAGEWHPRVVELYRGDELVGRFTADAVEPNAKVSDAVF